LLSMLRFLLNKKHVFIIRLVVTVKLDLGTVQVDQLQEILKT
jgi:hypothetical protein